MAKFVTVKRMNSRGVITLPGELIERDETERETKILLERGFLQVVPDGYRGRAADKAAPSPEEPQEETADDLEKLKRNQLDVIAKDEGLNPNDFDTKADVAKAIVAERKKDKSASDQNPFSTDSPNTPVEPTDEERKFVKDLSDEDIMAAIADYNLVIADEGGREAAEQSLLGYLVEHREPESNEDGGS